MNSHSYLNLIDCDREVIECRRVMIGFHRVVVEVIERMINQFEGIDTLIKTEINEVISRDNKEGI